ncbi:hypothetical protein EYR38_001809 [Pleurotus pulmonarius]|nr:hypothetical protein EYR38_001809 [Pleurotus pulmonarius]
MLLTRKLLFAGAAISGTVLGSTYAMQHPLVPPTDRGTKDAVRGFSVPQHHQSYDDGLFSPLETLDVLSEDEFTVLAHPTFPKYSVRAKSTKWSYTGYIDIEARHLFFYFFESRNDPAKDDVIFWTNGGPGCSSSLGLFMELGPCRVLDEDGAKFHPEAWNSNANIFFIDQPIGVGFSYADYGETVSTTEEAAKDIAAFVAIFFENFTKFKGRGFHMAGESYGGRYLPVFAAAVYDQNAELLQQGLTPINLTSVMIVAPINDISTCVAMKQMVPRCTKWFQSACIDHFDAIDCNAADMLCTAAFEMPFFASGKNPYDISKDCEGKIEETLCYPITQHINHYLDQPEIRDVLGVDPSVTANFSSCSRSVTTAFGQTLDELHPTVDYVAALLERNVRVLIYVGSYDWVCNWVGSERWTLAMEWSGMEEFNKQPLRDWVVDGKSAGKTRSAKGLTFATVEAAGHMVPYDKPKESLEMVQRWLAGKPL